MVWYRVALEFFAEVYRKCTTLIRLLPLSIPLKASQFSGYARWD
jgi:hypothetical protein